MNSQTPAAGAAVCGDDKGARVVMMQGVVKSTSDLVIIRQNLKWVSRWGGSRAAGERSCVANLMQGVGV